MVNKDVTKVCIGKIEELPEQLGKTVYIEDKELAVFKLAFRDQACGSPEHEKRPENARLH